MYASKPASLLVIFLLFVFSFSVFAEKKEEKKEFNHDATGYLLTGAHESLRCEQCHADGIFSGLGSKCSQCHNSVVASGKPINHEITIEPCEECHSTTIWNQVKIFAGSTGSPIGKFDHSEISTSCFRCHNGSSASPKPPNHILTTNFCENCHRTFSWKPVIRVDHNEVRGVCSSCHGSVKPLNHINSTNVCGNCHKVIAWKPVVKVDHDSVFGTCNSCHNNADDKPPQHIAVLCDCENCHTVTFWKPVLRVEHDLCFSITSCRTACHTKLPGGHVPTASDCQMCHPSTQLWLPVVYNTHQSSNFVQHNVSVSCVACHTASLTLASWGSYKPSCAGCHASLFVGTVRQLHPKTVGGVGQCPLPTDYTVAELQNCATADCHITRYARGMCAQTNIPVSRNHNPLGAW